MRLGKGLICLVIIVSINFSSVIYSLAQNQVEVIEVIDYASPVADGWLLPDEWQGIEAHNITLYSRHNRLITMNIEMKVSYNKTEKKIFFGVTIPQEQKGGNNYLALFFHSNTNEPFFTGETAYDLKLGANNDIKEVWVHLNISYDYYSQGVGINKVFDEVHNIEGGYHLTGTNITIEMGFPLYSGDIQGHDVKLFPGATIDFFIFYVNDRYDLDHSIFWQYDRNVNEYDYYTLKIEGEIKNEPIFYGLMVLAFGVLIISFISILINTNEKSRG
jgi:hypothetical protein